MKRKTQITTKKKNKRLNVIFFLDSEKTRSFSISGNFMKLGVVFLTLVAVWSGVSVYWINDLLKDHAVYQQKVADTLTTLFEYESKHSDMYKLAYPSNKAPDTKPQVIAQKGDPRPETFSNSSQQKVAERPVVTPKVVAKETSIQKQVVKTESIPPEISDTSFNIRDREVAIKFSIQNKMSPVRASGRVWVVLAMKDKRKGFNEFLVSPDSMMLNKSGIAKSTFGSLRFNIKNYKTEELSFNLPNDFEGDLKYATVFISTKEGVRREKRVMINKTFAKPIATVNSTESRIQPQSAAEPSTTSEQQAF